MCVFYFFRLCGNIGEHKTTEEFDNAFGWRLPSVGHRSELEKYLGILRVRSWRQEPTDEDMNQ